MTALAYKDHGAVVDFPNKGTPMEQNKLPNPLVHKDVDLRDFAYMPLDVVRFRDSDFAALIDGEAFRAGVLLWCAAWHQVPAGSLPADDRILANLAGYGRFVAEWDKVKEQALHGWISCNDGRLYHPVICEKASESWLSKQQHQYARFSDRMRKSNKKLEQENKDQIGIPSVSEWISSGCPKDWQVQQNGIPTGYANIPQEFQRNNEDVGGNSFNSNGNGENSAGIPSNSELKGKGNIRERDINNTHTPCEENLQTGGEWSPGKDLLLNVIRESKGSLAEQVLSIPDYQFHLGNFNAHWENKTLLTENQKTRKFAAWLIDKFDQKKPKPSYAKPQPAAANRNVNDAWGEAQSYAPAIDDVDTRGLI